MIEQVAESSLTSSDDLVLERRVSASLYPWQRAALEAWMDNGHRGVVEAVTGAGKTRVGSEAVRMRLTAGGRAVVVVPTKELLHQWVEELSRVLPGARIGRLGDGYLDNLRRHDVLVATVNSARARALPLGGRAGLLVVDECHRCGSEVNRLALHTEFAWRLGLSATHARSDGMHATVVEPFFDGVVYRFGYPEAIEQGVVARLKVALVAVAFEPQEREQYEHLSEKVRRARARLIAGFDVPAAPFGEFIQAVNRLRTHGDARQAIAAGRYLSVFNRRRALLAETRAKYEALAKLGGALVGARRVIVFTQTVRAAELAAAELVDIGIDAEPLHGTMDSLERRELLQRFARGHLHTIVAPQVLDEGLDVPDADLGVIVAASRQRRQMIQRMGRVLRPKLGGRLARFVVLYVQGTSEDPARGAHETFLDEVVESAVAVRDFPLDASTAAICGYLNDHTG